MVHKNPWYIITEEEISQIQETLHSLRDHVPEEYRTPAAGALGILTRVQVRRP